MLLNLFSGSSLPGQKQGGWFFWGGREGGGFVENSVKALIISALLVLVA